MGKGVDKLRYSYYYGKNYFNFIGALIGFIFALIYGVIDGLNSTHFQYSIFIYFLIIAGISDLIGMLIIKLVLMVNPTQLLYAGLISSINGLLSFFGIYLIISSSENIVNKIIGIFLICIGIGIILILQKTLGRVKIYPNRVYLGPHHLFFRDIQFVKWQMGKIEEYLTEEQKKKKLNILSPLINEYKGKDFIIHLYHLYVETESDIYIVQSIAERNQLVQNVRNGWLEKWRWDGSTTPPEGWDPTSNCKIDFDF